MTRVVRQRRHVRPGLVICSVGLALLLPACRTGDAPAESDAINPAIVIDGDTLAPDTIASALAARIGGTSRGGRVFCAYTLLGQDADRIAVWALCQELVALGDSIGTGTGASAPALLVTGSTGRAGGVRIAEVRVPRDGGNWSRDVETIFSRDVSQRIRAPTAIQNRRAQRLLTHNQDAARAFYGPSAAGH